MQRPMSSLLHHLTDSSTDPERWVSSRSDGDEGVWLELIFVSLDWSWVRQQVISLSQDLVRSILDLEQRVSTRSEEDGKRFL